VQILNILFVNVNFIEYFLPPFREAAMILELCAVRDKIQKQQLGARTTVKKRCWNSLPWEQFLNLVPLAHASEASNCAE
jgi:hypothetical protein